MPLLATAATAAIGAAIGNFFQRRQFTFRERETRLAELRKQKETFVTAIMGRVSERVFYLIGVSRIITDSTLLPDEVTSRLSSYEESIKNTLLNYSTDLALLTQFFDQQTSDLYIEIMQGPNGFVTLDRKWREIYTNYKQLMDALPKIQQLLDSGKISTEKAKELKAAQEEYRALLHEKAKELITEIAHLGNEPIGEPFFSTISSKEDFMVKDDSKTIF
ncbi:MAG: hypothetical protein AAF990_02250 [Bacteroidota bacterium]